MSETNIKSQNPTLYIVATPIGNLSDVSFRAIETLKSVKYIACEDTRTVLPLLQKYGIDSHKTFSCHKFNELEAADYIINIMSTKDCDVALISDAGTPCVSDPGTLVVKAVREHGIRVVAIPGACAAVACISMSGMIGEWAFMGFLPRDNKHLAIFIQKIKDSVLQNFIIYESPKRVLDTLEFLNTHFSDAEYFVAKEITKIFEYSTFGSYQKVVNDLTLNTKVEKGEYVIILRPNLLLKTAEKVILSPEAMIVQSMIEGNSLKDSISILSKNSEYSKNQLYQASLRLKDNFFDNNK